MSSDRLKPCPFCGSGEPAVQLAPDRGICMNCHASGPEGTPPGAAIARMAWNRRAPSQIAEVRTLGQVRGALVCIFDRLAERLRQHPDDFSDPTHRKRFDGFLEDLRTFERMVEAAEAVLDPNPPTYNHGRGDSALTPCPLCIRTADGPPPSGVR